MLASYRPLDYSTLKANMNTYMEKLKKLAPIVGLTLREKVLPTWRRTSDVLPTPVKWQIIISRIIWQTIIQLD